MLIEFSVVRLVGVGEASFISLAAPFIDDNAPASQVYQLFLFYFVSELITDVSLVFFLPCLHFAPTAALAVPP